MTENKYQKMSMEILLKNKKILEEKPKNYYSEFFNAEFDVECKNPASITNIFASDEDENRKYIKLVYECCPFFKEEDLRKVYDIKEPYELVNKVFGDNYAELFKLGNFILEKYGFLNQNSVIEKIKKL